MVTDLSDTCRKELGSWERDSWSINKCSQSLSAWQTGTSTLGPVSVLVQQIFSVPSGNTQLDGGPFCPHLKISVPNGGGQTLWPFGASPGIQKACCHMCHNDSLVTSWGFQKPHPEDTPAPRYEIFRDGSSRVTAPLSSKILMPYFSYKFTVFIDHIQPYILF